MKITRVTDKVTRKMFLDTARIIYMNDPVWVCPLDEDIEAIFDPEKNTYFRRGEAERYILEDDSANLIGQNSGFY